MSASYYCLVAGLPEIHFDDHKLPITTTDFRQEVYPQLDTQDKALVDLLFHSYDHQNLLAQLNNKESATDRGTLQAEMLQEMLQEVKETDTLPQGNSLPYIVPFIKAYINEQPLIEGLLWEDQLTDLYYNYAQKTSNKFLRSWFEFNLNLNNLLIALQGRKYRHDISDKIIGQSDISVALRTSNARDFGLSATIPYLEEVSRISEEGNTVEREKKIDLLRWQWIEEESRFNYFSIEKVLAYLLQLIILERWAGLNAETGQTRFREQLDSIKGGISIPQEFLIATK